MAVDIGTDIIGTGIVLGEIFYFDGLFTSMLGSEFHWERLAIGCCGYQKTTRKADQAENTRLNELNM